MNIIGNRVYELISSQEIRLQKTSLEINEQQKYVITKSIYWGICTSDVKTFVDGQGKYFGHEMIIQVIKTNSFRFQIGEYLTPLHTSPNNKKHTIKLGFQEYSVFYEEDFNNLIKIVPVQPVDNYIFFDTVSCVFHAYNKIKPYLKSQTSVCVLGDGFISKIFHAILRSNNIIFVKSTRNSLFSHKVDLCIDTTGSVNFVNNHLDKIVDSGKLVLFSKLKYELINFEIIRDKNIDILFPKFMNEFDIECAKNFLNKCSLKQMLYAYNNVYELKQALLDTMNKNIIRGYIPLI